MAKKLTPRAQAEQDKAAYRAELEQLERIRDGMLRDGKPAASPEVRGLQKDIREMRAKLVDWDSLKPPTAPLTEQTVVPTVIRAPEVARTSEEWLRMSAPLSVLIEKRVAPIVEPRLKDAVAAELAKRGFAIKGDSLVSLADAPKEPEPTPLEIALEKRQKAVAEATMRARGAGVWELGDDPNTTDAEPTPLAMFPRKDN
jgi:hypothetical protein